MNKSLSPFLQHYQQRIDQKLKDLFATLPAPSERLRDAMQYSSLVGGKRLRALLVYATGHSFNLPPEYVDTQAIAVELIHSYSLVHDDLPAMDDDDLRRGQASCHKAFDEATAILAGDALQTLAFEQLSKPNAQLAPAQQLRMMHILSTASGIQGMAGGQALDLASIGQKMNIQTLQQINELKTGALIVACVHLALAASLNVTNTQLEHMHFYAEKMGLAFQVQDDLLDVLSDEKTMGKKTGKDAARKKPTYPAVIGVEKSKQLLANLKNEAIGHLHAAVPHDVYLHELTRVMIHAGLIE
ncbi:MAG: farnesyl diphosphate synthase [Gammaproteobacteria bacterium]